MKTSQKLKLSFVSFIALVATAAPAFADRYQDIQATAQSLTYSTQALSSVVSSTSSNSYQLTRDAQRLADDANALASSLRSPYYDSNRIRLYQQMVSDYNLVRSEVHSSYTISLDRDDSWYARFSSAWNDITQAIYRLRYLVGNDDIQPGPQPLPPPGPGPGPGPQPPAPPQPRYVAKALTPQTSGGQSGGDFVVELDSSVAVRSLSVRGQTASYKVAYYSDATVTLVDGTTISHNGPIGALDGSGNPRVTELELIRFPRDMRVKSIKFHVDRKIDWFYIMGYVPEYSISR